MNSISCKLIIAVLAACPAAGLAQDLSSYCLGELQARGFTGYDISNVQPRGNNVRGILRKGGEVREFQCDVDFNGTVRELRVDFVGQADSREAADVAPEYKRGYADGYRRAPYNNFRNDDNYDRGYDAGHDDRRRRR
jgi:hypothetical protein